MPNTTIDKFHLDQVEWFKEQIGNLTEKVPGLTPSEWAEGNRYLPASVTPLPGYYNYDVAPALREIVDCMDMRSPIRELSLQKGAQICATVGILENTIGYIISHVKNAPTMMLTADAELAKFRMESYITPMIQLSDLEHLIKSADETNRRKTGKTDKKLEWVGGGFLIPLGAKNAAKLRSFSIQYLLEDEIDAYPYRVGKDGDPIKLAEARTKAYYQTRKILRLSTPLIKGQSPIVKYFKDGDQRYYNVPCKKCKKLQVLRFEGIDKEDTGLVWGLIYKMKNGILVPGSVRYACRYCGHQHVNSDKTWMMKRGKWIPTATPKAPDIRSYHLSSLYAPASMFPWEAMVRAWLAAWDKQSNRPHDLGLLQEFYNNNLGEPFEIRGDSLRFSVVSAHRRTDYQYGEIPNNYATEFAGGPIQLLTCATDVHEKELIVAVFGWTRGLRTFLIDYFVFVGNPKNLDDPDTWGALQDLIEERKYIADDGREYQIAITLVDSGYSADIVYRFCSQYQAGVFPIKGRTMPTKSASGFKEFSPFVSNLGTRAFNINVDIYKDRWSAALRRNWSGKGDQPNYHFNAPVDSTDKQIKQLTVERKREKLEKATGKKVGYEWYRPSGSSNELWDLLIYNNAALDLIAWDTCIEQNEMESVIWEIFWNLIEYGTPEPPVL